MVGSGDFEPVYRIVAKQIPDLRSQ